MTAKRPERTRQRSRDFCPAIAQIRNNYEGQRLAQSQPSFAEESDISSSSLRCNHEDHIVRRHRNSSSVQADWEHPIGAYVHIDCLENPSFRRYPGDWNQRCIDPRNLNRSASESSGSNLKDDATLNTKHTLTENDGENSAISKQDHPSQHQKNRKNQSSSLPPSHNSSFKATVTSPVPATPLTSSLSKPAEPQESLALNHVEREPQSRTYHCKLDCKGVWYSQRDLEVRHYGPSHENDPRIARISKIQKYRYGFCGKSDFRQDNHSRHLQRKRAYTRAAILQTYFCGRCGHETSSKEEYLEHLRSRRSCS